MLSFHQKQRRSMDAWNRQGRSNNQTLTSDADYYGPSSPATLEERGWNAGRSPPRITSPGHPVSFDDESSAALTPATLEERGWNAGRSPPRITSPGHPASFDDESSAALTPATLEGRGRNAGRSPPRITSPGHPASFDDESSAALTVDCHPCDVIEQRNEGALFLEETNPALAVDCFRRGRKARAYQSVGRSVGWPHPHSPSPVACLLLSGSQPDRGESPADALLEESESEILAPSGRITRDAYQPVGRRGVCPRHPTPGLLLASSSTNEGAFLFDPLPTTNKSIRRLPLETSVDTIADPDFLDYDRAYFQRRIPKRRRTNPSFDTNWASRLLPASTIQNGRSSEMYQNIATIMCACRRSRTFDLVSSRRVLKSRSLLWRMRRSISNRQALNLIGSRSS
jgi:hypothetical protein